MIGTNASGAHSLKYEHTIDYHKSVELVLYDGSLVSLEEANLDSEEWKNLRSQYTRRERVAKCSRIGVPCSWLDKRAAL
jgi:hypothetical protein